MPGPNNIPMPSTARALMLIGSRRYNSAEEGLFHPDDLFVRDPEQLATIRDYAARAVANVDRSQRDANRTLQVLSRHEFCERMLWGACWRNRDRKSTRLNSSHL